MIKWFITHRSGGNSTPIFDFLQIISMYKILIGSN